MAVILATSWIPFSTPAPSSSVQSLYQHVSNVSSLGIPSIPMDARFDVDAMYHPHSSLPLRDCLMVAVNTMADLALLPWNSRVRAYRSHVIPKYNQVSIEVDSEPPANEIETRFLVWGFNVAMLNIIHHRKFVESDFKLKFDGRTVGWVRFRSENLAHDSIGVQGKAVNALYAPTLLAFNASDTTSDDRFSADIHFQPEARPMNTLNTFIVIFCVLQSLALPPSTGYSSQNFRVAPRQGGVRATFSSTEGQGLPRRSPPFLQYRWIIETMRQLPGWMLDNGFAEVAAFISVDGIFVGAAFLDVEQIG